MLDSVTSSSVPLSLRRIGSKTTLRIAVKPATSELCLESSPSSTMQSSLKPCMTQRTFQTPTLLNSKIRLQ